MTIDLADRDLEFLMANDADLFNRWQAANIYAVRTLIANVSLLREGKRAARGLAFANALKLAIADNDLNPAYRAELLRLPSQTDIAREIGRNIDPERVQASGHFAMPHSRCSWRAASPPT